MALNMKFVRIPIFDVFISYSFLIFIILWQCACAGVFLLNFFLARSVQVQDVPHFAWNKSIGHVSMFNLALLFIPVSRRSPILRLFRISWELGIRVHKLVARYFIVFVLVHGITFMVLVLLDYGNGMASMEDDTLALASGLVSGGAMIVMALTSWFAVVRRKNFEFFYLIHHCFIIVVFFALVHTFLMQSRNDGVDFRGDLLIYYMILPLLIYIADRIARIFYAFQEFQLANLDVFDGASRIVLKCDKHKFKPGQYAFVNCPSISLFEWHPFSYSSSSTLAQSGNLSRGEFLIMDVGKAKSWTRKLSNLAKIEVCTFLFSILFLIFLNQV